MENKFKKLCTLLFTCATIFGLSYNTGVIAKASDNLQVTTGQAVKVTTSGQAVPVTTGGQAVEVTTGEQATIDIFNDSITPLLSSSKTFTDKYPYYKGYFYARCPEDEDCHWFLDGVLVRNCFVNYYYRTYFVDENGLIYLLENHKKNNVYKFLNLIKYDNTLYAISGLGEKQTGWVSAMKKDMGKGNLYKYTDFYYCDKDGKALINVSVDGIRIGADGKVVEEDKTEDLLSRDGSEAEAIFPL